MPHRRNTEPTLTRDDELTSAMAGIGMMFAAEPTVNADIEDTLISASVEGVAGEDLRTLSVLCGWLEVHSEQVNVDRLYRALQHVPFDIVLAFWAAIGHWRGKDRRYVRLQSLWRGPRLELVGGQELHYERHGEDERFVDTPIRLPANILRRRQRDVLAPERLARLHVAYRWRLIIGPAYRADVWAALELDPRLSAAALAKRTRSSFEAARQVKRDWRVLNAQAA